MKATFGVTVRAARLGYHWMDGVGFVRIRAGGPPHPVDVAPADYIPVEKGTNLHVIWWDGPNVTEITEYVQRHFSEEVTEPLTLMLDDHGKICKSASK